MKNKSGQLIDKIIRLYISGRYHPEVEKEFYAWFVSDVHRKEKETVLKNLFEEIVQYNERPDQDTKDAFRKLSVKLGLPVLPAGRNQNPKIRKDTERIVSGNRNKRKEFRLISFRTLMRFTAVLIPFLILIGGILSEKGSTVLLQKEWLDEIHIIASDQPQEVLLPDSSKVWINVSSEVSYKPGFRDGRFISLQGEAYFDVSENPESPFIVRTKNLEITVLGTTFNVADYRDVDDAIVSLYKGSVRVEIIGKQHTLTPGKALAYKTVKRETEVYEHQAAKPAWLARPMEFEYRPLSDIFRIMEQEFGVRITEPAQGIPDDTLSIYFDGTEKLEEVLFRLSKLSGKFKYSIENDKVIITK